MCSYLVPIVLLVLTSHLFGDRSVPMTGGISVEPTEPNFIMPSPVHVFTTVEAASEYIGFRPQMPKLLPVGFNIQSGHYY